MPREIKIEDLALSDEELKQFEAGARELYGENDDATEPSTSDDSGAE